MQIVHHIMPMREAIKNFSSQFGFNPKVENAGNLRRAKKYIVCGMGGSHWAADLLKVWRPELDIVIHRNYGLPAMSVEELRERLLVLSSYSGNTEETLDAYRAAKKNGLNMAALSVGGELMKRARKDKTPYIQFPDFGIQPRLALGLSAIGLLKFFGEEKAIREISTLERTFDPEDYEATGKELAMRLRGRVPVIYSSEQNGPIAFVWKIKFNETGKIPAFANVFPELNHNEMTGFSAGGGSAFGGDVKSEVKKLCEKFYFIILRDPKDHPKILKRMEVLERLYKDRDLPVEMIEMKGKGVFEKIFSSLILADWAAYYTAENYGLESEQVPMVEEFKNIIKQQ